MKKLTQMTPACAIWSINDKFVVGLAGLVPAHHILYSSCAPSVPCLCFIWCQFWHFIFHKVD